MSVEQPPKTASVKDIMVFAADRYVDAIGHMYEGMISKYLPSMVDYVLQTLDAYGYKIVKK